MKIALLCSGLGNVFRGHEIFASNLFDLLRSDLDLTLFKGGGDPGERQFVIPNIARDERLLDGIRLPVSPRWQRVACEQERLRIETETFAHAALRPLLEGDYDVIHCLEREVCERLYGLRHLFRRTPRLLFSNGGAIPAHDLPHCDFIQEHTPYNLCRSRREKAFMIPHGVDVERFRPGVPTDFRERHGIPGDAFVVLTVGTICYWHKRMDHVIREVSAVQDAWLVVVGQDSPDSPEIKALGERLMPGRIVFTRMPNDELPQAYAAADVFTLGSLFETFGIVYIEAMAAGLPIISTDHPNQQGIIEHGIFIDMKAPGALSAALRSTDRETLRRIGMRGREVALRKYDLRVLKQAYIDRYRAIAATEPDLPGYDARRMLGANLKNLGKHLRRLVR